MAMSKKTTSKDVNDRLFASGGCLFCLSRKDRKRDTWGERCSRCPWQKKGAERVEVGNELTAASGGIREANEWQWSKSAARKRAVADFGYHNRTKLKQAKNFGYRNRKGTSFRVGTKALPSTLFVQSQVPAQLLRSFLPPLAALPRSPSRHLSFLWVVVDMTFIEKLIAIGRSYLQVNVSCEEQRAMPA